jgi:hypothetical protein
LSAPDHQPVIALASSSDWNARQMELHLAREADLPLTAFFLFVAYDLAGQSTAGR